MILYFLAVAIGIVAGLRSMTTPAVVSWGAHFGWLKVQGSPVAFLGFAFAPFVLTVLMLGELVADKLPKTPSRKAPGPFIGRILSGALGGAAIGASGGSWIIGLVAGVTGAVIGTIGGADIRGRLAKSFGKDFPAALLEDVVAVGGAFAIVYAAA